MGEYVEQTDARLAEQDRRIAALESALTAEQAAERKLVTGALEVVGHAESDGTLAPAIPDAARPGGALPGDLPAGAALPGASAA